MQQIILFNFNLTKVQTIDKRRIRMLAIDFHLSFLQFKTTFDLHSQL